MECRSACIDLLILLLADCIKITKANLLFTSCCKAQLNALNYGHTILGPRSIKLEILTLVVR